MPVLLPPLPSRTPFTPQFTPAFVRRNFLGWHCTVRRALLYATLDLPHWHYHNAFSAGFAAPPLWFARRAALDALHGRGACGAFLADAVCDALPSYTYYSLTHTWCVAFGHLAYTLLRNTAFCHTLQRLYRTHATRTLTVLPARRAPHALPCGAVASRVTFLTRTHMPAHCLHARTCTWNAYYLLRILFPDFGMTLYLV